MTGATGCSDTSRASPTAGASLVYGAITRDRPLIVTSHMADNGVIFSDGIEADYLTFTAGS